MDKTTTLSELPRVDHVPFLEQTWLVSCPALPLRVHGAFPRVLFVLGKHSPPGVFRPLYGDDCLEQAVALVVDLMRGKLEEGVCGIPTRMLFTEEPLFEAVHTALQGASALMVCSAHAPYIIHDTLDEIMAKFGDDALKDTNPLRRAPRCFATSTWPQAVGGGPGPVFRVGKVALRRPVDDEHRGQPLVAAPLLDTPWLKALDRLSEKAMIQAGALLADKPSLARKYFGSAPHRDRVLSSPVAAYAGKALYDWIWLDHRVRRRDKSLAEQLLPDLTDPLEREALESMICRTPSLYRVARVYPGRCVLLEDLLQGSFPIEVHDRRLSLLLPRDVVIPARVLRIGPTWVLSSPGPVIPRTMVTQALDFLDRQGLKPTDKGLAAGAHLLGRLWHWRSEQHLPEHIINSEGEDVVVYRAVFLVADSEALRRALRGHGEIELAQEPGLYAWAAHPAPATTDNLSVRAWLRLQDGILRLSATSVSRWLQLYEFLAAIPGVALARVSQMSVDQWLEHTGDLDGLLGNDPIDDPLELPDDDAVTRRLHVTWVSVHNPYLDDLTPTEAIRTPRGWRRVAQLMRCLPRSIWDVEGVSSRRALTESMTITDSAASDEMRTKQRIFQVLEGQPGPLPEVWIQPTILRIG